LEDKGGGEKISTKRSGSFWPLRKKVLKGEGVSGAQVGDRDWGHWNRTAIKTIDRRRGPAYSSLGRSREKAPQD